MATIHQANSEGGAARRIVFVKGAPDRYEGPLQVLALVQHGLLYIAAVSRTVTSSNTMISIGSAIQTWR
jgi:hypothetical protein